MVVEVKVNITNLKRQSIAQLRSGIFWVIGQGLSDLKIREEIGKKKVRTLFLLLKEALDDVARGN